MIMVKTVLITLDHAVSERLATYAAEVSTPDAQVDESAADLVEGVGGGDWE